MSDNVVILKTTDLVASTFIAYLELRVTGKIKVSASQPISLSWSNIEAYGKCVKEYLEKNGVKIGFHLSRAETQNFFYYNSSFFKDCDEYVELMPNVYTDDLIKHYSLTGYPIEIALAFHLKQNLEKLAQMIK